MEAADSRPPTTDDTKPSSRSVANLSLDKLYRKRAIDRENQRELRSVCFTLGSFPPVRKGEEKSDRLIEGWATEKKTKRAYRRWRPRCSG